MSNPRKHHYLQRAYLAGFALDGWLHVFDRREGKTFRAKPGNVGHKRDFYRVEKSEVINDEFVIERELFQRIDGDGLPALLRFAEAPSRAKRRTAETAMLYMAAAYLRTPQSRERIYRLTDRMLKSMMREIVEDEAKWQRFISFIPEESRGPTWDAEKLRQFALSEDDYEFTLDRNWTVALALGAMIPVAVQGLSPRHWVVMRARRGQHFVTGDSPLTLIPSSPDHGPTSRLDAPDTIAVFPVNRNTALIGRGENALRRRASPRGVAAVNRITALKSHRQVYSPEPDFEWEDDDGSVIGSARYLELGEPGPDVADEAHQIPPGLSDGLLREGQPD